MVTQRQINRVRERLPLTVSVTDEQILEALVRARAWINWRIYDESIVAMHILVDGYPHA